ncbi:MAG: hypothetical protein ACJ784_16640 [Myxococcales bacterium]
MTKFLVALSLVLASAAARAEDRTVATVRETAPAPATAVPEKVQTRPAQPVQRARVEDEHQMFHVGAMLGLVSLPRPAEGEVFVKFMDFVSVGFSYSDFPNFVADPVLQAAGVKTATTQARLDEFTAYEGNFRIHPFQGAFFFGSSFGHQSLRGAVTESTDAGPQTGTADIQTLYATPRLGFLWSWNSGFLLGVDGGVQLKLSSTQTVTLPPNADLFAPNLRSDVNKYVDAGASYPLPSFHFRLGWQF